MSIYQVRTFAEILSTIREELQFSSSDTTKLNRIKRDVNAILNEIAAEKNWWWLQGSVSLQLPAYISSGTATATAGQSSVTLTIAPVASMKDYWFAVDGFQEVYRVESHAAGATTLKLDGLFSGSTSSTATFKLWKDCIPLPTDCKETTSVYHEYFSTNLDAKGRQEFRRITALNPRAEGKPAYYYTGDFKDPSQTSSITSLPAVSTRASTGPIKTLVFASGLPTSITSANTAGDPIRLRIQGAGDPSYNGDVLVSSLATTSVANDTLIYTGKGELQESATSDSSISVTQLDQEAEYDRYRELFLYPCLNTSRTLIHVDYIKQVLPLNNDSDEPTIPLEDRMVLVYGALSRAWSRDRNPDEAARNLGMYKNKLAKMAGKFQDSQEAPRFGVNKEYLRAKRSISTRGGLNGWAPPISGSGAASSSVVTGTANSAAIFNGSGELVASPTVSSTELGYLDGATSNLQSQINALADPALNDAHIFVGNSSNKATDVAVSGDLTLADTGAFTVATVGGSTAANVHSAELAANAATNTNTASTIVKRDASGNFTAGTVTAALTGTASTATAPASGSAHGAVTLDASGNFQTIAPGTAGHYVRSNGTDYVQGTIANTDLSGITNTQLSGSAAITNANLANMASSSSTVGTIKGNISGSAATPSDVVLTSANTVSSAVYRDGSGNFSAGTITAALTGNASTATSATTAGSITGNLSGDVTSSGMTTAAAATQNNITSVPNLATVGTISSGTWAGTAVGPTHGGTNQTTFTKGDTLYSDASNSLAKLGIGTSGQFLKTINGIPGWGPGANGINYLTSNPDAETDTAGWTTYDDGASATPVDGTGGSPTFTWTRSTSSPLRGTGSFLATKDAANRQGQGVAYAITLDSADQAKPICISFDYTVGSGTYVDGDLTVYLYDVTNSVVIQPAPYKVLSVTAGVSQKWIGYFPTSAASTSYRFIIHTASTSASAYTVKFDNFNVGPTYQSYGAVQTDAVAATLTPSAGFGTTSAQSTFAKRDGDTAFFRGYFKAGTVAASEANIQLPSPYVIDSSKVTSTASVQAVGVWRQIFAGATTSIGAANCGPIFYDGSTTNKLYFSFQFGSNTFLKANGSAILGNADGISLEFAIPISGWSSNVQVSSDADTRVCAANYTGNAGTVLTGGTTNIDWSTKVSDTHAAFNGTTFTAPVSGFYRVSGVVKLTASAAIGVYMYVNTVKKQLVNTIASAQYHAFNGGIYLNANDALTIRSDTGATLSNNATDHVIYIARESGPAQIAASESVNCRYTNTAGTSLTKSAANTVPFATKDYDTHNAFVTDTFTCPMAGKYEVTANVNIATGATWASGDFILMAVYKNGALHTAGNNVLFFGTFVGAIGAQVSAQVSCVQGDTITINVNPTKAAASNVTLNTTAGYNSVSIARVGN